MFHAREFDQAIDEIYDSSRVNAAARDALQRLSEGRHMFGAPARSEREREKRRRLVEILFGLEFVRRGAKGPEITEEGLSFLAPYHSAARTGNREWSDKELETLRALYTKAPASEIAERLGRTVRSVKRMAERQGVTRQTKRWDADT